MQRIFPLLLLLLLSACNSSTPSSLDAGGSSIPHDDGALCACATPDCLPNCSDLPACRLACSGEGTLDWVDSCGNLQYAQLCDSGCVDASTSHCQ